MVHHVLTRQTLHDRIWTEPVCAVASSLGLSDVGLLKACRRAGVQTPPRGYWTRARRQDRLPDPPVLTPRPDLGDWVVIAPARRSGTGRRADEATNDPGVGAAPVRPAASPGPLSLDLALDPGWHASVRAGRKPG
jgi:hypothetical protein